MAAASLLLLGACNGSNLFTEPGESGGGDSRGAIVGSVISAGIGMGDVHILLLGRDSVRTDGQGDYRFANLPAGTYTVSIRVPFGFELAPGDSTSVTRVVAAGGEARADWTLLATGPVP
jgi:hypothetical protein